MPTFAPETLIDFGARIFHAAGAPEETARAVAESLVGANLVGHDSHGIIRVNQYLSSIDSGGIVPDAEPQIENETSVMATVNAGWGFGQRGARFAVELAIRKAKEHGLAAVGLYNCGHVGRLGEWVHLAADDNLVGLAFCNGGRTGGLVTPFGGAARRLGTNPLAAAVPLGEKGTLVLDFATSAVAEGKVRVARNGGKTIPSGWILNEKGEDSNDPQELYDGGMLLPAAGHKGYGLSLLVDLMGGALTGAGCAGDGDRLLGNGVLFIVLDIESFRPLGDFFGDSESMVEWVKSAPPAPGFSEVLLPGEPESKMAAQRRQTGLTLDDMTWAQLEEVASKLGVSVPG